MRSYSCFKSCAIIGEFLGMILFSLWGNCQTSKKSAIMDRTQLSLSYTYNVYLINLRYPNIPIFEGKSPSIRSLGIAADYVLYHVEDFIALNLSSRGEIGLQFTNPMGYYVSLPISLIARLGANSTPYNNSTLGVGLGVGIASTFIAYNYTDANNSYLLQDKETILGVLAIGELNLNYGTGMGFRFTFQIFPFSGEMPITPFDKIPVTYRIVSLGLVYYLN